MATKKKMLQAAAGNATGGAGGPLNVEDVFSTYLYDGTGDNQTNTVTNGLDLSGEGGMVWTKCRNLAYGAVIFDSERGLETFLYTDTASPQANDDARSNMSFNSDGYSFGSASATSFGPINEGTGNFASWTFRKAPKFFDMVTYTGNGVAGRTISHNLGATVGAIVVKCTSADGPDWTVFHRSADATAPEDYYIPLNITDGAINFAMWNDTAPTSSEFTVGSNNFVNGNGNTYVAYLFAHNDGDGEFGPDGDADIIKCGSYTGNGSADGPEIDLGFEPQWVMIKRADGTGGWSMWDSMRGVVTGGSDQRLYANDASAEEASVGDDVYFTATGFGLGVTYTYVNASGGDYIYIAIRRGTKVPESGAEVFQATARSSDVGSVSLPFSPDALASAYRDLGTGFYIQSRLTLAALQTAITDAEAANTSKALTGESDKYLPQNPTPWFYNTTPYLAIDYAWKRAPNFFDVVAYTGDSTAGRAVSHNLGVAPELYIIKFRASTGGDTGWLAFHHEGFSGNWGFRRLDAADSLLNATSFPTYFPQAPTEDNFYVGTVGDVNFSGATFIAYLFASLAGVSKVGSYTGNGTSQTIDCGFASGARFVLIKRADSTGDWYVWDTERGIVTGNDPHLSLNTTATEVATDDSIDPDSSGFIVNQVAATNINVSSASYVFYAIA